MSGIAARLRARLAPKTPADDSGTALVLALLVVLVVGTLLAAVLDFTRTGLTVVPGERDDRNTSNYIQGAVQGAINSIRGSSELGREDVADCPTFTPNVPAGVSGVTGKTFTVTCSGVATGSTGGDDRPRFAIHALGSAPEGIRQVAGNSLLYINGGIYSRGVVSVSGGSQNAMRVNGTITARGDCVGPITTTDPLGKNCNAGPSVFDTAPDYYPALADDAALQSLINTGMLSQGADPVPSCASGRVVFEPGYYSVTPGDLAARLGVTCSGAVVYHFKPGIYYFDYPGVWNLNSTKVIAGTYVNSTLGTSCDHTDDTTPAPGAQFILGGGSRIFTKSASGSPTEGLEVCGPEKGHILNGKPQRIALYVLSSRDSLTSPAPSTTSTTFTYTAGPTSTSTIPFLQPSNARQIDGTLMATAALSTKNQFATLEYDPITTTPPKGSEVSGVAVRVAQTLATDTEATLRLSWLGSSTTVEVDASSCPSNLCDITSELADHDITWRALAELSITYVLKSTKTGVARTSSVDGIELAVTYRPPGLRATTCVGACVLLESQNNPNVFFHGTVYAPASAFAVRIHNSGETIFDRGVVVRDIAIDMNSSSKQTSSPFSVPSGTPTGRLVLFRGYVDGVEKVRACARYTDEAPNPDGTLSAYAGWSLSVPRWLVMRTPSTSAATCS